MQANRRITITLGTLLTAAVFVVYWPATSGDLIWDDHRWIEHNPLVRGQGTLSDIWFSTEQSSQYFPVVYTAFRIQHALWGLDTFGYHIVNITLHALTVFVLWRILHQLKVPAALLAATIFAFHPIHAESVAWIVEHKNTLSALFMGGSVWAWLSFVRRQQWGMYALSLALFALALLSKSTSCTLPAALVLSLWLMGERVTGGTGNRWLQIAPYVALGLVMGLLTTWWEGRFVGGHGLSIDRTGLQRVLEAAYALWFYPAKLIWPDAVGFAYPKPELRGQSWIDYTWLIGCVTLALLTWRCRDRVGRGPIAGVLLYAAMVLPMLGLIDYSALPFTLTADRYIYPATIGLIATAAALLWRLGENHKGALMVCAVALVVGLGVKTRAQCAVYQDEVTYWGHTLRHHPSSHLGFNIGGALLTRNGPGDVDEAIVHLRRGVALYPDDGLLHYNLALALLRRNDLDGAERHYRSAIERMPNYAPAHGGLRAVYGQRLRAQSPQRPGADRRAD